MKKIFLLTITLFPCIMAMKPQTLDLTTVSLDYDTFVIPHPDAVKNAFKDFILLETPRLILRKINDSDVDAIFELASDTEVTKHTAALELIKSKEDAQKLIQIMRDRYEKNLATRWAVVDRATQKTIGICGFVGYAPAFARAEIGYAFCRTTWGKGIATEAAQAIVNFGFDHMNLNRIEATVDPENIGSTKVIEKLGMKFEGILREHIWSKGEFKDRKMYAILKSDRK